MKRRFGAPDGAESAIFSLGRKAVPVGRTKYSFRRDGCAPLVPGSLSGTADYVVIADLPQGRCPAERGGAFQL